MIILQYTVINLVKLSTQVKLNNDGLDSIDYIKIDWGALLLHLFHPILTSGQLKSSLPLPMSLFHAKLNSHSILSSFMFKCHFYHTYLIKFCQFYQLLQGSIQLSLTTYGKHSPSSWCFATVLVLLLMLLLIIGLLMIFFITIQNWMVLPLFWQRQDCLVIFPLEGY